jgi:predicted transcriptional regulator
MTSRTALISIHPEHALKILSGEKRLEFRRVWATRPVERLLIYCTSPKKRMVAVATIKRTIEGTPSALWASAQSLGGGIGRERLFKYFRGSHTGYAVEICDVIRLGDGIEPTDVCGRGFRPPQSFRYLLQEEDTKLDELILS